MGSKTQNRLKLAFQLYSHGPWTLNAAKSVLAEIAIKQPTIFLESYRNAKDFRPDIFREFTSVPLAVELRASNTDALLLDHDELTPEPATVAPVVEELALATEAPSEIAESPVKAVEKPKKARPAKRSKKLKQVQGEASGLSADVHVTAVDLPASAQEVKPAEPAEPAEPTELTSVCLDSFEAASQYLLLRALVQFAKVNEAKAQEILSGKLPVEIDSFCQKIHANNLRRALVRVKGTKVSLKTTPIATEVK